MQTSSSAADKPAVKEDSKATAETTQESGASATAATAATAEAGPVVEEDEGGHDPFEGLDDITKTCFEVGARFTCHVLNFASLYIRVFFFVKLQKVTRVPKLT